MMLPGTTWSLGGSGTSERLVFVCLAGLGFGVISDDTATESTGRGYRISPFLFLRFRGEDGLALSLFSFGWG